MLHREQSIGEKRGLNRMQNLVFDRRRQLEERLGLIKKQEPLVINEDI